MSMSKTSRMLNLIDYRIKVILQENRVFIGTLMAFDKHMNLVLGDCEERRKIRSKNPTKDGVIEEREEKMVHGLVLLRGENIITIQIESPPPQTNVSQAVSGPGKALAVGRGLTSVPLAASSTLTGPLRGLGGPDASTLTPQNATAAPSMPHPRNMMPNMPGVPGMPGMMPPRGMMPPNGIPGMPGMMPPRGMMPPNGMPGMPGMMPPRGMMPPNGMPGMPPRP